MEFATPLEEDEDRLDAFHDDDEPLRYRTVGNILGDTPTPEPPPRLFAELHLTHAGEPASYAEGPRKIQPSEQQWSKRSRRWSRTPPRSWSISLLATAPFL